MRRKKAWSSSGWRPPKPSASSFCRFPLNVLSHPAGFCGTFSHILRGRWWGRGGGGAAGILRVLLLRRFDARYRIPAAPPLTFSHVLRVFEERSLMSCGFLKNVPSHPAGFCRCSGEYPFSGGSWVGVDFSFDVEGETGRAVTRDVKARCGWHPAACISALQQKFRSGADLGDRIFSHILPTFSGCSFSSCSAASPCPDR